MEATQNRVTRKLIGYLAAPAFAAVLGLGAHVALADTVSPTSTAFTASSSSVSFKLGTSTVTCTGSSTSGTTPAGSTASGTQVCTTVSNPTFTGCKVSASGFTFNATLTSNSTNGAWQFCLAAAGPTGQRAAALKKCKKKHKSAVQKKKAQDALTQPVKKGLNKKFKKCKRKANQLPV